ncbi:MAG: hypothetical protein ACOC2H_00660 [Spirochaetota bacterium]
MEKDVNLVRKAVEETRRPHVAFLMLPVSWGIWNILAALASIYFENNYLGVIWGAMMSCALLCHILLYRFMKRSTGFMRKDVSDIGKVWIVISLSIFEVNFIFGHLIGDTMHRLNFPLVAVFVGIGLAITGLLVKGRTMLISGILWIVLSNLYVLFHEHVMVIHIINVMVTLIIIPSIMTVVIRRRNDA